jgi:GrpB-like predicted nucleotidyltransferase (UPF0157 family)
LINPKDKTFLQAAIDEPLCICDYDSSWPEKFRKEKTRLLQMFSDSIVDIEHIGSTAVPGLGAKPIIDLMGGLKSIDIAEKLLGPLREYGYFTPPHCNDGLTDRRWLLRHSGGHRTHHLHLVLHGGEGWRRTIQFRDALCADPEIAKRYEKLKRDLVTITDNNRSAYISAKSEFVEMILKRSDK